MNNKGLGVLGIVLAVAGAGVSIASGIVSGKKQENHINEAVSKEVAKQLAEKK